MKIRTKLYIKNYLWNQIKKFTNNFSNLSVESIGNGYIKCLWSINTLDSLKVDFSKSCFYAIRLFDISNNRDKNLATCIMKEIEVNKFQSSLSFPIPIDKGVYYFELGYRKRNGEWRVIASQNLNLGYRIKKVVKKIYTDNWFISKNDNQNIRFGPHEEAYQLSLSTKIGGSESMFID